MYRRVGEGPRDRTAEPSCLQAFPLVFYDGAECPGASAITAYRVTLPV